MKLPIWVFAHIERILKIVLQFTGPADALISRYFREHPKLGVRERAAIAESIYIVLRNRLIYSHFAESGSGAYTRRLALMGLSDLYPIDALTDITENEREWLEHIHTIDRTQLPTKLQTNLPDWLYRYFIQQYGEAETLEMASVLNTPAPLDLRVNTLKCRRENAIDILKRIPVNCESTPYASSGVRLAQKVSLQHMPLFKSGCVEVQDEGSQLLAQIVGAKRGEMVIDFCAGAGGKTLALGAAMRNTGRLYAFDVSERRLANMKPRLARSGLSNVHPIKIAHEHDAKIKRLTKKADRVLVDSPCSGLGTLRRNPDLKWRQTEASVIEISERQRQILESAARLVKVGGRLIYATCSLLAIENDAVAVDFLKKHSNYELIPMNQILDEAKINLEMGEFLKLMPHKHQTDGFFAAVFRRKS